MGFLFVYKGATNSWYMGEPTHHINARADKITKISADGDELALIRENIPGALDSCSSSTSRRAEWRGAACKEIASKLSPFFRHSGKPNI